MKNKEYYNLKELRFMEDGSGEVKVYMGPLGINGTPMITKYCSIDEFMAWLEKEKKLELSEDEKVILRNLDLKYKWILRTDDLRILYVSSTKPKKQEDGTFNLRTTHVVYLNVFNGLFQSIGENMCYSIEELLND